MPRKRLIFFVTADPAGDPSPLAAAYHLASTAASVDLEAEVRLAGDAVLVADPAYAASVDGAQALRERVDAAADRNVDVTVCPRSVDAHGIRQDQLSGIGARPRPSARSSSKWPRERPSSSTCDAKVDLLNATLGDRPCPEPRDRTRRPNGGTRRIHCGGGSAWRQDHGLRAGDVKLGRHGGEGRGRARRISQALFLAFLGNEAAVLARTPPADRRRAPTPRFPAVTVPLSLAPLIFSVRLPRRVRTLVVVTQAVGFALEFGAERQLMRAHSFSTAPDAGTDPQQSQFYRYLEHPIYVGLLIQLCAFSTWFPPALLSTALSYESLKRGVAAERAHLATLGAHHRGMDSWLWG